MKNFYKNKKILITGHTGFKGSWLALWLKYMGSKVLGISNKNFYNSKHFKQLNLNISNYFIDIRDQKKVNKIVVSFKPDIIFHLAAQSLVKKGYEDSRYTFDVNVNGHPDSVKVLHKEFMIGNMKEFDSVEPDLVRQKQLKIYLKELDRRRNTDYTKIYPDTIAKFLDKL